MTNVTTKDKLLKVANDLFSKQGYGQTSIRDIATKAGVNVAAVNYHFRSKEALYWEIFFGAYQSIEAGTAKLAENSKSLEDLACGIYDHMLDNSDFLRNTFKMFLSESAPVPLDDPRFQKMTEDPGPPGSRVVAQIASQELGESNEAGIAWLVHGIFTFAVHWALKSCSSISEVAKAKHGGENPFAPEMVRKALRHHVRASIAYLKTHPKFD